MAPRCFKKNMGYRNNVKEKSNKIIVAPQTLYHLHQLAQICGYKTLGKVVDKLVREKMEELKMR